MKAKKYWFVLVLFILGGYLLYYPIKNSNIKKKISNLHSKEVLVFKNTEKNYSFGKIDTIENGVILFRNSNFTMDKVPSQRDYYKALKQQPEFFDYETVYYSQIEVDSLYRIKRIIDVFKP